MAAVLHRVARTAGTARNRIGACMVINFGTYVPE
jgi:hypothetical protein